MGAERGLGTDNQRGNLHKQQPEGKTKSKVTINSKLVVETVYYIPFGRNVDFEKVYW